MKKTNKSGFTLIELLIVIGIIAILAAAVIIAINPGQQFKQARNATRWSHMNSVANSFYSYVITAKGAFPACTDGGVSPALNTLTQLESVTQARDLIACETDLVGGGHMSNLPQDPQQGTSSLTGYKITFDGIRVKIMSSAAEAIAEDLEVIQ
jgi:prepilin-type N-terminal cleavage/methylation domain-containing protein